MPVHELQSKNLKRFLQNNVITTNPEIKINYFPKKLKRGEKITLKVTLLIPEGIHIQAHKPAEELLIPTKISLKKIEGISFGEPIYPKPSVLPTSWSKIKLLMYEGKIEVLMSIQVEKLAKTGKRVIEGSLSFQGCTSQFCLPPKEQKFELTLMIS